MATLKLANSEVLRAIGQVAGIARAVGDWDSQTQEDARQCIRSGLRRFFSPPDGYQWKFLERPFYRTGEAVYTTGTVTVAAGVVTLASSTWPSWAADGLLRIDGHTLYVTAVTDTTHLVVSNTGVSASAGSTYELYRYRFELPDDFGDFVGGVVYQNGNQRGSYLRNVVDSEIRLRHAANFRTGDPCIYSVVAGSDDTADNDRWYFLFWPLGQDNASFLGTFTTVPDDNLETDITTGTTTIQADQVHADTVLAAILSAAEEFFNNQTGVWTERFNERLTASIQRDKHSQGPIIHELDGQPGFNAWAYANLFHVPIYNDTI